VDPRNVIYGYGRRYVDLLIDYSYLIPFLSLGYRICPGRDLANQVALYFITLLLWGFDIVPVEGEQPLDRFDPRFIDSLVA